MRPGSGVPTTVGAVATPGAAVAAATRLLPGCIPAPSGMTMTHRGASPAAAREICAVAEPPPGIGPRVTDPRGRPSSDGTCAGRRRRSPRGRCSTTRSRPVADGRRQADRACAAAVVPATTMSLGLIERSALAACEPAMYCSRQPSLFGMGSGWTAGSHGPVQSWISGVALAGSITENRRTRRPATAGGTVHGASASPRPTGSRQVRPFVEVHQLFVASAIGRPIPVVSRPARYKRTTGCRAGPLSSDSVHRRPEARRRAGQRPSTAG